MEDKDIKNLRTNVISLGRLLWDKDLVTGLNGNISGRVDEERILLTAHGSCLGLLSEADVLLMTLNGEMLETGKVSSEKLMHTEIYKHFPNVRAIVHTHTTYTNAFYLHNKIFQPSTFEARFMLGEVVGIDQHTPAVTDAEPLIEALKKNSIVVLRNHGVVAVGPNLFDCFLLIQALEEQIKIDAISRLYGGARDVETQNFASLPATSNNDPAPHQEKKYKLFSQEQIDDIVKIVNSDSQLKEMGKKTAMNMDLAVLLNETGQVYSFKFQDGQITGVGNDQNAEFLISAPEAVWRAVFNREIDPFVATTQKKMNLRGDFARISRWYAPCSRIFQLWQQVPVE